MVAFGAMLLASKGLFAKTLYAHGLDHHDVSAIRAVIAVPGFALLAWWGGRITVTPIMANPSLSAYFWAAFAGLLCYYAGALANFYSLTLIDASVERPLLFSYPAVVVLLSALLTRTWPKTSTLGALLITFVGIFGVTGAADASLSISDWRGIGWVMFSSATIAIYFLFSESLTRQLGSGRYTLVAMSTAGAAFALHYQCFSGWDTVNLSARAWLLMLGLVIIATVLPLYIVAEGVRRIGASRAALVSTLGPPAAALMALEILDETLSQTQWTGMALVIGAVVFIEYRAAVRKNA